MFFPSIAALIANSCSSENFICFSLLFYFKKSLRTRFFHQALKLSKGICRFVIYMDRKYKKILSFQHYSFVYLSYYIPNDILGIDPTLLILWTHFRNYNVQNKVRD